MREKTANIRSVHQRNDKGEPSLSDTLSSPTACPQSAKIAGPGKGQG